MCSYIMQYVVDNSYLFVDNTRAALFDIYGNVILAGVFIHACPILVYK